MAKVKLEATPLVNKMPSQNIGLFDMTRAMIDHKQGFRMEDRRKMNAQSQLERGKQ